MDALRISTTDLDRYRQFRADEDADLAEFLAELRRKFEPSEPMRAGSALHKALETIRPGDHGDLKANGYTFTIDFDDELDIPETREAKRTGEYLVDGCRVTLVAKVDGIHGKRIDDHKLTGYYDAEKYLASYQWRAYLDVFGANEFRWNVFNGKAEPEGSKHYRVWALHTLSAYRYPAMREDVERELGLFVEFARRFLPERVREAA